MLEEWLPSQLENDPDLTLKKHCATFEKDSGMRVSTTATMSRRISRLPGGGSNLQSRRLFPLDGARRLAGNIQSHPIHARNLVDDAVAYPLQEIVRQSRPV